MAKGGEEGQILARLIIEMMGAPKEHVDETIRGFVQLLKQDKKLKLVQETFAEPLEKEGLFTTFVELEIWFESLPQLLNFCFEAMPSSVEVLEPASMNLQAVDLSGYLNDLQARLHTIDMALKNLTAEHEVLKKNAEALFTNLVFLSLRQGPKSLAELSDTMGIKEELLKPLLSEMVASKQLAEQEGRYVKG